MWLEPGKAPGVYLGCQGDTPNTKSWAGQPAKLMGSQSLAMTSPSLAISPGPPSTHFLSPALPPLDQGSGVGRHWENVGQNAEETCLVGMGAG